MRHSFASSSFFFTPEFLIVARKVDDCPEASTIGLNQFHLKTELLYRLAVTLVIRGDSLTMRERPGKLGNVSILIFTVRSVFKVSLLAVSRK